jgi:hypothetical protein
VRRTSSAEGGSQRDGRRPFVAIAAVSVSSLYVASRIVCICSHTYGEPVPGVRCALRTVRAQCKVQPPHAAAKIARLCTGRQAAYSGPRHTVRDKPAPRSSVRWRTARLSFGSRSARSLQSRRRLLLCTAPASSMRASRPTPKPRPRRLRDKAFIFGTAAVAQPTGVRSFRSSSGAM